MLEWPLALRSEGSRSFSSLMAFISSFWVWTLADWLLLQPEVEGRSCSVLLDSRLYASEPLGGDRLWELELGRERQGQSGARRAAAAVHDPSHPDLLLLSVVSSIRPESLPLQELRELRVDARPCVSLSIPPSLSLSPESFPLETPSMSSTLDPLWWPDEPPEPPPGDETPPGPPPCSSWPPLAWAWPLLALGEPKEASWPLSFSSAVATRPRVLVLDVGLGLA